MLKQDFLFTLEKKILLLLVSIKMNFLKIPPWISGSEPDSWAELQHLTCEEEYCYNGTLPLRNFE